MALRPRLYFGTVFEVAIEKGVPESYVQNLIERMVNEYIGSLNYRLQDFFKPPLSLSQLGNVDYASQLVKLLKKKPS